MVAKIEARTITFDTLGQDGGLLVEFLKARKRAFVDTLGWSLPTVRGMEFDQYDTPFSSWVVVHRGDEILGGVRLTPTTASVMGSSYMLRDAQMGRLMGIPTTLLSDPAPVSPDWWEASRVLIAGDRSERAEIREVLLAEMLRAAHEGGARRLLCILPTWWPRLARSGLVVKALGEPADIGGSHQAVEIDVINSPLRRQSMKVDERVLATAV